MVALAEAFVRVRPEMTGFRGEVERELDRADFGGVGARKGAEFGDGVEKGSRGKTGPVGERRGKEFSAGFKKGSDSGFSDFVAGFSRPLGAIVSNLPAFALFTGAATAATASVVRLGSAMVPAIGVLATLPAAAFAAVAAGGAMSLAFHNVSDAIGAGLADDAKKFGKATKDMATETLGFVNEVVKLRPQLIALRNDVSNAFFVGFRDDVRGLAQAELPTVRIGLIGIIAELHDAAQSTFDFGRQSETVKVLSDAFVQVRATLIPISNAAQPILSIFRDLIAVGSIFLPSLTSGFDGAAVKLAAFVSHARETGQLREFIQGGIDVLTQIGGVLSSVIGIFSSLFRAMQAGGGDALGSLSNLLAVLDAILGTKPAQDAMISVFRSLSTITQALGPAFGQLLVAILPLVPPLAQLAAVVGVALAQAIIAMLPLITSIVTRLAGWVTQLSQNKALFDGLVSAISAAATFLLEHQNVLGGIVLVYGSYRLALLANAAAHQVTNLATKASTLAEQAHNVAKTVSMSTLGTWIGVKYLELAAWVRSTASTVASTIAQGVNTAALFVATGGIQAFVATKALELAAWIRSAASTVAATAATVANGIAMAAVRVATVAWTAVQWLLNAALTANPIGIVVVAIGLLVAAIVIAWRNSETFRNIVLAVWAAVKAAIIGAWDGIKAAWDALVHFIMVTIPAAFTFGINWIKAKWTEWSVNIQVEWLHVQAMWQALTSFIRDGIPAAFQAGVNWVKAKWTEFAVNIQVEWLHVKALWNELVIFVRDTIVGAFRTAVAGIQVYWNLWRNLISAGWDFVKGIFNALKLAISGDLPGAFRAGVDAIKAAWERVRAAAREPIAFVVNSVINPLVGGFNKVAGAVGLPVRLPTIGGFASGGRIPGMPSATDNRIASGPGGRDIAVASGEYIVNSRQTTKFLPVLEAINTGRFPSGRVLAKAYGEGYASGGLIGGALDFGKSIFDAFLDPAKFLATPLNAVLNRVPGAGTIRDIAVAGGHKLIDAAVGKIKGFFSSLGGGGGAAGIGGNASPGFPPWPSSPGAQRGDSGVWRSIVALIRSTGPVSGAFGNAYRPGDPLWHGSGRAVDWMGFNQDALATFLAAHRPLELIHRSGGRDYAYTRGRNMGSFNQALMEQHRNHVHIAMKEGGLVVPARTSVADSGQLTLAPGANVVLNNTGRPEHLSETDARVAELLAAILGELANVGPSVGKAITTASRAAVRTARAA